MAVFEGENPVYVDKQASALLKELPCLAAEMDDSTCCGRLPRTFNAVLASIARGQQLMQVALL
ncbi:hypothetical protein ACWD0G_01975 [Streptomyces goshikiensis]